MPKQYDTDQQSRVSENIIIYFLFIIYYIYYFTYMSDNFSVKILTIFTHIDITIVDKLITFMLR